MTLNKTWTVQVDPEMHGREPGSDDERLVWAAIDTASKILREAAGKIVVDALLAEISTATGASLDARGIFLAGLASGDPDAPTGYLDLAGESDEYYAALEKAFRTAVADTVDIARRHLGGLV